MRSKVCDLSAEICSFLRFENLNNDRIPAGHKVLNMLYKITIKLAKQNGGKLSVESPRMVPVYNTILAKIQKEMKLIPIRDSYYNMAREKKNPDARTLRLAGLHGDHSRTSWRFNVDGRFIVQSPEEPKRFADFFRNQEKFNECDF